MTVQTGIFPLPSEEYKHLKRKNKCSLTVRLPFFFFFGGGGPLGLNLALCAAEEVMRSLTRKERRRGSWAPLRPLVKKKKRKRKKKRTVSLLICWSRLRQENLWCNSIWQHTLPKKKNLIRIWNLKLFHVWGCVFFWFAVIISLMFCYFLKSFFFSWEWSVSGEILTVNHSILTSLPVNQQEFLIRWNDPFPIMHQSPHSVCVCLEWKWVFLHSVLFQTGQINNKAITHSIYFYYHMTDVLPIAVANRKRRGHNKLKEEEGLIMVPLNYGQRPVVGGELQS